MRYLTSEISGSDNLIIVSDELEDNNVIKMINCYNTDVVLNLSKLSPLNLHAVICFKPACLKYDFIENLYQLEFFQ